MFMYVYMCMYCSNVGVNGPSPQSGYPPSPPSSVAGQD